MTDGIRIPRHLFRLEKFSIGIVATNGTEGKAPSNARGQTDFCGKTQENVPRLLGGLRQRTSTHAIADLTELHKSKTGVPKELNRTNKIQKQRHLVIGPVIRRLLILNIQNELNEILENDEKDCDEQNPSGDSVGHDGFFIERSILAQNTLDRKAIQLQGHRRKGQCKQGGKIPSAVGRSHNKRHDGRRESLLNPANPVPSLANHLRLMARSKSVGCLVEMRCNGNHEKCYKCLLHIEIGYIAQHQRKIDVTFGIEIAQRFG